MGANHGLAKGYTSSLLIEYFRNGKETLRVLVSHPWELRSTASVCALR